MGALTPLPYYRCRLITAPFSIDGDVSKPVWHSIASIELRLANGYGQPGQATSVRGCWDGANLYLAFECQDSDIRATYQERDALVWQEEAVEAFLAPDGNLHQYYEFQCSPLNVVRDLRVTSPKAAPEEEIFEGSWDCTGWKTAVGSLPDSKNSLRPIQGWSAEWCIPLAELKGLDASPVQSGDTWRVNLFRIDRWPQEEYSSWSVTPGQPFTFHRPSRFGYWLFE